MNEAQRIANNQMKLQELYPSVRTRMEAVLKEMEKAGYRPRIQTAWRSEADQLEAYRRGTTKVKFGFHNTSGASGAKEALAADVWDDDRLEQVKVDFMLHLVAAAEAQGLATGIRWDLAEEDQELIDLAVKHQIWDAQLRVGWDPLHVEPVGLTIQEVKDGQRPDFSQPPPVDPEPVAVKRNYRVLDLDTGDTAEYHDWSTPFKPVTLLPVPYLSQLGEGAENHRNDCGAVCAVMLLRAYTNTTLTPDQFYGLFNVTGDPYLSVPTLRNAMGKMSVLTSFKAGMQMTDLFNTLATAKPVIVLIHYKTLEDAGLTERHYEGPHLSVAVGMDSKYIYLHDPLYTRVLDGEAHAYPLDIFWKAWKDVALNPKFPNPERSAIIPASGLGYRMERAVKVNISALNVRSGPSLTSKVVGSLKRGQVVYVTREVNGWGEIGPDRWIYLPYTLPVAP